MFTALDTRITVKNGYGVDQEYSVDTWSENGAVDYAAHVVPNRGGPRLSRRVRSGTKVYARIVAAINAAKPFEYDPDKMFPFATSRHTTTD